MLKIGMLEKTLVFNKIKGYEYKMIARNAQKNKLEIKNARRVNDLMNFSITGKEENLYLFLYDLSYEFDIQLT